MKKPKSSAFASRTKDGKVKVIGPVKPKAKIDCLAERVKRCYIREREKWESRKQGRPVVYKPDPGYYGKGAVMVDNDEDAVLTKAIPSVWHKLALALRAKDIHPETYIQILFSLRTHEDRRVPEPMQLLTPECMEIWERHKDKVAEDIGMALRIQRRLAEQEFDYFKSGQVSSEICWERVLSERGIELSALFRYCLAFHLGGKRFTPIATSYEAEAMMQFERHRDLYRQIWGNFLPMDFAERSRQMYPELLAE